MANRRVLTQRVSVVIAALGLPHLATWIWLENQAAFGGELSNDVIFLAHFGIFMAGGICIGAIVFEAIYLKIHPAAAIVISFLFALMVGVVNWYIGVLWPFVLNPPYL